MDEEKWTIALRLRRDVQFRHWSVHKLAVRDREATKVMPEVSKYYWRWETQICLILKKWLETWLFLSMTKDNSWIVGIVFKREMSESEWIYLDPREDQGKIPGLTCLKLYIEIELDCFVIRPMTKCHLLNAWSQRFLSFVIKKLCIGMICDWMWWIDQSIGTRGRGMYEEKTTIWRIHDRDI